MQNSLKPIIFLDHDGVMCLAHNWGSRFSKASRWAKERGFGLANLYDRPDLPANIIFDNFDQKAVKVLNRILHETGADVVVSSDWRIRTELSTLQEFYRDHGVIRGPIGMTPVFRYDGLEATRVQEIQHWLENNPHGSWVAVDDMNLSALDSFVLTPKSREGIKQSGVADKIIKALKG